MHRDNRGVSHPKPWRRIEWRREEEEILKQAVAEGFTIHEIFEIFPKRTHGSIRSKLQALGLRPPASIIVEPDLDAFERIRKLHKA